MFYIFLTISCTIIYLAFCQLMYIPAIFTESFSLFSEREDTTNNATHGIYFARYHCITFLNYSIHVTTSHI